MTKEEAWLAWMETSKTNDTPIETDFELIKKTSWWQAFEAGWDLASVNLNGWDQAYAMGLEAGKQEWDGPTDEEVAPQKRSFSEDVGRLLSTGKGFYDDGTPIDDKEIQLKIESVGDGVVTCTEVHLPRPPQKQWVGLTDADKQEAFDETQEASGGFWDFADYLEAKLKEKNT